MTSTVSCLHICNCNMYDCSLKTPMWIMAPPSTMATAGQTKSLVKGVISVLTAPLWFFDAVDKEAFIMSIPVGLRRFLLR